MSDGSAGKPLQPLHQTLSPLIQTAGDVSGANTVAKQLQARGINVPTTGQGFDMAGRLMGTAPKPDAGGNVAGMNKISDEDRQKLYDDARRMREQDMAQGAAIGQSLFGSGSLGRLNEGRDAEQTGLLGQFQGNAAAAGQRSGDISQVIGMRKAGLAGLSAPEYNAARDQAMMGINQDQQTALRQLRGIQGAQGVRGGLAGAQQAQVLNQGQLAKTNAEQQLFLQNVAQKQQALNAFEQSATGAETNEFGQKQIGLQGLQGATQQARQEDLARQQFNIGQTQQERFGQLAAQLGYASLGAGERAGVGQQLIGQQQAQAAAAAAQQGGKK